MGYGPSSLVVVSISILLTIIIFPSLSQDVFAASGISSAVANDPDDGDTVYSVRDTITITFPATTNATSGGSMSNAEFRANFTVATTDIDTADTVTGTWSSTSVLLLTIGAIGGADPPQLTPIPSVMMLQMEI